MAPRARRFADRKGLRLRLRLRQRLGQLQTSCLRVLLCIAQRTLVAARARHLLIHQCSEVDEFVPRTAPELPPLIWRARGCTHLQLERVVRDLGRDLGVGSSHLWPHHGELVRRALEQREHGRIRAHLEIEARLKLHRVARLGDAGLASHCWGPGGALADPRDHIDSQLASKSHASVHVALCRLISLVARHRQRELKQGAPALPHELTVMPLPCPVVIIRHVELRPQAQEKQLGAANTHRVPPLRRLRQGELLQLRGQLRAQVDAQ